jgi:excisionase family DNA binding protein
MAESMTKGGNGGGMANSAAQLGAGLAMGQQMMTAMGANLASPPGAAGTPPPVPAGATPAPSALPPGTALPELLSPADAAKALGVTENDVMTALNDGSLKGKKIGSAWRITRAGLDEFLKS